MYYTMYDQKELPDLIRKVLNSREPKRIHDAPAHCRHAGVLIPLILEKGVHKVLFTKRTHKVEHHKGQFSFPGGATDDEDRSIEETVLRESYEEIGLAGENVALLGRIDEFFTRVSSFVVHPFVGLIPSTYEFIISEIEVERLIKVPWDTLIMNNLENKKYTVASEGVAYQTPAYEYNGDLIWGATAHMMDNLITILNHKCSLPEKKK
jgi:8-oxo-dGTP pyrophosphatase MutT (NUDIX family)